MADLPTGTVTLMFTDLEGSTQSHPQARRSLRRSAGGSPQASARGVRGHGGREVDTSGDGSFIAFPSARDGVAAAVAASGRWPATTWPDDAAVLTRMALHTGEPRRAEQGYHGMGVHLAARLCQAGRAARSCCPNRRARWSADDLPAGSSVRDLGERSLKDFDRPQAVFEVVIEGHRAATRSAAARGGAGGGRRRLGAAARGDRAAAGAGGIRGGRPGRQPRRPGAAGGFRQARRGDHRHPHAADAHRRGTPGGRAGSGSDTRRWACWCCRSTSRPSMRPRF